MGDYSLIGNEDVFAIGYSFFDEFHTTELSMFINGKNILGFTNDMHRTTRWNLDELAEYLREFLDTMADDPFPVDAEGHYAAEKDAAAREFDSDDYEVFDQYYDRLDEWGWRHTWHHASAGAILEDVYFQQVGDTVEISWNNEDCEDDIVFDCKLGGASVPKDIFIQVVNDFLQAYALHWFNATL